MADNANVNKVVYGETTLIDLTGDTATAADVAQGKTFHDASGALSVGTASGGGSALQILVTAPTGSTVAAEKDGQTYTATESTESPGTWEISVPEYGTYTVTATLGSESASDSVTVTAANVRLDYVSRVLNDNSWSTISRVSRSGTGDTWWDYGDAKEITLDGTVGTLTLSEETLCVFILDFNHAENGTGDNNIIWSGFKSALSNGVDIALRDWTQAKYYGDYATDGTKIFNLNHWGSLNYGGWKGCDYRYDILGATSRPPSDYGKRHTTSCVGYDATEETISDPVDGTLMAALPADFRNVLRLRTHYVDNKGNKSNEEENVTSVVDAISLLAEFEIFGERKGANEYEKDYQSQMAYYASGNSKIRYAHNDTTTAVGWRESSPQYDDTESFRYARYDAFSSSADTGYSYGLAPVFKT